MPSCDDLKAFSATFATTSAMPMFHLCGITPVSGSASAHLQKTEVTTIEVTRKDLRSTWIELNSAVDPAVELICLGNPHFSESELKSLADLCKNRHKHPDVGVIVTVGRQVHQDAAKRGYTDMLENFGVQLVNDTCWCMINEPIIPVGTTVLMTNSGKYAHYGPGLVNRSMHFGSLKECVDAACTGQREQRLPDWLSG